MNIELRRNITVGFLLLYIPTAFAQVTVTDDLQRAVTLTSPVQRIVSLAPSITETLFAIGAGEQIVGVTEYCNYPEQAKAKRKVGGITNPSVETIISLKPDLIVVSMEGNMRSDFDKLTSFGVPVFVTNPRDLNGIYKSIEQLGVLCGKQSIASTVVRAMKAKADSIGRLVQKLKRRSVLFFVSSQPIIVVGKNTFLSQLIELAGGSNTAVRAASTYPTYSREAVLKDNPDVLIFMSDVLVTPDDLPTLYPEWRTLKAWQQKNIYRIDPDIVSRPGPRAVNGLEALFTIIH